MTTLVEKAQVMLKSSSETGNVAYAIVGPTVVRTAFDYCFGNMMNYQLSERDWKWQLNSSKEEGNGSYINLLNGVYYCDNYMCTLPGEQQFLVLRATNIDDDCFTEPTDAEDNASYQKVQREWLAQWEYCLVPATFEERRENGVVVDLNKIGINSLGVFLVGSRNLYEHNTWRTIEQLQTQGWGFQEAFTVAQFVTFKRIDGQPVWSYSGGGHCILNDATAYNDVSSVALAFEVNLFFTKDARIAADASGLNWCIRRVYENLHKTPLHSVLTHHNNWINPDAHWSKRISGCHVGEDFPLYAPLKGLLKEVK